MVKRVVTAAGNDALITKQLPHFKDRRTHLHPHCLNLGTPSDNTAVIVGVHSDWLVSNARVEGSLGRHIEIVYIHQRDLNWLQVPALH